MSDVSNVSNEIMRHEGMKERWEEGMGRAGQFQQPLGLNSHDDDSRSRQPLPRMTCIK